MLHIIFFAVVIISSSLSQSIITCYLFFVSVGTFCYFFGSSFFLYLPYAHGSEMAPFSRFDYFCLGVGLNFLFHEFPLAFLQLWVLFELDITSALHMAVFFLTLLSAFISFLLSWFAYASKVGELLQNYFSLRMKTRMVSGLSEASHPMRAISRLRTLDHYDLNQIWNRREPAFFFTFFQTLSFFFCVCVRSADPVIWVEYTQSVLCDICRVLRVGVSS